MLGRFGARQADFAMHDVGQVGAGQRARRDGFLIVPASAIEPSPLRMQCRTLIQLALKRNRTLRQFVTPNRHRQ